MSSKEVGTQIVRKRNHLPTDLDFLSKKSIYIPYLYS